MEVVAVGKVKPHHARIEETFEVLGLRPTLTADQALADPPESFGGRDGAAVVVLTQGKELWCATDADSRCVASVVGTTNRLLFDYNPMDTKMKEKLSQASRS